MISPPSARHGPKQSDQLLDAFNSACQFFELGLVNAAIESDHIEQVSQQFDVFSGVWTGKSFAMYRDFMS
jgi:hypothetical protein